MFKTILATISISVLALVGGAGLAFGQGLTGIDLPSFNSIELKIKPENPEPLQPVTLELSSYSFDLNRSKVTWMVDGVVKKTEMGLKTLTVQAKKNGQKTNVKVSVETPSGETQEIDSYFIPSLVDLVYEAYSYVPPFYKGKALNANQGVVLVAAMPELVRENGERIPTKNIVFSWKKDGQAVSQASGLGKNSYIFQGSIPIRDYEIEVLASSIDNTIFAFKSITITNREPMLVFYEKNPVYGVLFNRAINSVVRMLDDEFSALAVPFFFSVGYPLTPDLNYTWTLNGQSVGEPEAKDSFTVRLEKSGVGTAKVGLEINNNVRIFQFARGDYSINFEKE